MGRRFFSLTARNHNRAVSSTPLFCHRSTPEMDYLGPRFFRPADEEKAKGSGQLFHSYLLMTLNTAPNIGRVPSF